LSPLRRGYRRSQAGYNVVHANFEDVGLRLKVGWASSRVGNVELIYAAHGNSVAVQQIEIAILTPISTVRSKICIVFTAH
jgi:hypothetical protein